MARILLAQAPAQAIGALGQQVFQPGSNMPLEAGRQEELYFLHHFCDCRDRRFRAAARIAIGFQCRKQHVEEKWLFPADQESVLLQRHRTMLDHPGHGPRPRQRQVFAFSRQQYLFRALRQFSIFRRFRTLQIAHVKAPLPQPRAARRTAAGAGIRWLEIRFRRLRDQIHGSHGTPLSLPDTSLFAPPIGEILPALQRGCK